MRKYMLEGNLPTEAIQGNFQIKFEELTKEDFFEQAQEALPISEFRFDAQPLQILSYKVDLDLVGKEFVYSFYKATITYEMPVLHLPAQTIVNRATKRIEIPYEGTPLEGRAKNYIRDLAKKHPNYRLSAKVDAKGETSEGTPIPIDTLGKWLFGVPNYRGHIIVEGYHEDKIVVYLPDDCPKEAIEMFYF